MKLHPEQITVGQFYIRFKNEEGIDQGGLRTEWLSLMMKEAVMHKYNNLYLLWLINTKKTIIDCFVVLQFDPLHGLWSVSENRITVQPSPSSCLIPNYLTHFEYTGILVAKSIINNQCCDINFTKSFLKHILGKGI